MQFFGDILGIGTVELVIIAAILLLLFGGAKLPQLAKSIGTSVKELRKGVQDDEKATDSTAKTSAKNTSERA